jgi:choline monooxygenase
MTNQLRDLIDSYNPNDPIDRAFTIPSSWYTNRDLYNLELQTVFTNSWQLAARIDQLERPGQFVTTDVGTEPVVIVRGADNVLRGFFNVCRHHAAAVMTEPEGTVPQLRCPYHGWTYSLSGELKGTPDFNGVCNFDREKNGLAR